MNKKFLILPLVLALSSPSFSQMYILNEDFSGTAGSIPPVGWNNIVLTGVADDKWHFDNPGQQILNYPITAPFAIFDAEAVSPNGLAEEIALETPVFDASISNFILLNFHHTLVTGSGGIGKVFAFDGDAWQQVAAFNTATENPQAEIVDLSAVVGGITNARLRFVWSGSGTGFWAIDNIRIYASQPLDGGIVEIESPTSPITPGIQQVVVTLGNFGYNTITSTTIHWSANGVQQPDHTWNGSVGFGQTQGGIAIGTYDFQIPVLLKVWQSNPNGGNDPNPYNDTISKQVEAALCGTYTIGGSGADFQSFSAAASTLNSAGITCPVTFLVRNGTYYDQFILREIPGVSITNTVTFKSESGDSTQAVLHIPATALKYEPMIYMADCRYVMFKQMGFSTGSTVSYANIALDLHNCSGIQIEGCYFDVRNQFDLGLHISGGSREITVSGNSFKCTSTRAGALTVSGQSTRDVQISGNTIAGPSEWGYVSLRLIEGCSRVSVTNNIIRDCFRAIHLKTADSVMVQGNTITNANDAIILEGGCTWTEISGNRLSGIRSHQNVPDGTNGILVDNCSETIVFNNFVQTVGEGITCGITLADAGNVAVYFNSVRIGNNDLQSLSAGFRLLESHDIIARNNIFRVDQAGIPVSIDVDSYGYAFDRNDYHSFTGIIGSYAAEIYTDLDAWSAALGMDESSVSVMPFFTSNSDLSINQALLNNTGMPGTGIDYDIDGIPRNPDTPDFGAKEYDPCFTDAGINAILAPGNPLGTGNQAVSVELQNQGTASLGSVTINWTVNDMPQPSFPWTGTLAQGQNAAVDIGTYDFQPGVLYIIRSWTSGPNGQSDCNFHNDTIVSNQLASPLCGTYTIGGADPDFLSFRDAAAVLNLAGISCPVVFLVRNGLFREQIVLRHIPGTSAVNTVTFRSESGDSSLAVLQIPALAQNYASMVSIIGSEHLIFTGLGFFTGATSGIYIEAVTISQGNDIEFEGCNFELKKDSDKGLVIRDGSQDIRILSGRMRCENHRAQAIVISDDLTGNIQIRSNHILGAPAYGTSTMRIGSGVSGVTVMANRIESCYRAIHIVSADNIDVSGNILTEVNDGIYIDEFSSAITVEGNRLLNVRNNPETVEGTSAVSAQNSTAVSVFNNFIRTAGNGPVKGIVMQNTASSGVWFNSVSIASTDARLKSKGLLIKGNNNLNIRNNIFSIASNGTPVVVEGNNPQLSSDRNDYFSPDDRIGWYNGVLYNDLSAWISATGMDQNSLSVQPFFTSETDLSVNQSLLNGAASPVSGVTTDIDGTLRNTVSPDIGAREFELCPTDAGINAITAPRSPLTGGNAEVRVILQNQGASPLTSVTIYWTVNAGLQDEFQWNGSLGIGQNVELSIGSFDFQQGEVYSLKVWTSDPNGSQDCNALNDTALIEDLSSPLCGIYTIGGANPDFVGLAEAASVLNRAGIACPVTFSIREGTYTEQIVLKAISGSSAQNTITFRSETGDSADVRIRILPEALKNDPVILLEGTSYVTFSDISIITGSEVNDANYGIQLIGASDISVERCLIRLLNDSDIGFKAENGSRRLTLLENRFDCLHSRSGAIRISGNQTGDIAIEGNRINGALTWGNSLLGVEQDVQNVSINGNLFEKAFQALFISSSDTVQIHGNTIRNVNGGISASNFSSGLSIRSNRLYNVNSHQNSSEGTEGILIQNCPGAEIVNNFIHTTGIGPCKGISLENLDTCKLWYNSVHITNTDAQGRSRCIVMQGVGLAHGRDNILSVKALGIPMEIGQGVETVSLDYNDYYQQSGIVGRINNTTYTSLPQWGQVVNGDANSKVVNPYFKADTIPLPFQRALNGAGIAIQGITADIDGKSRSSQAPDIGCLEFFVDYGILDLLSPSLNCFHPEPDSVIVYIRQYGDVPFNDLKIAYQMNNGTVHKDTIPGPHLEDIIHNFGLTENLVTYGDYLFKVWLINTLDDNIINDTLYAWRYSKPSPEPGFTYDNFCTGPKVFFFGQSTVPAPYYITGYEWLFGDGETSGEQNPVHTYASPGTYQVTFRAYSDAGCYGEVVGDVFISPEFIPLTLDFALTNETCLWSADGQIVPLVTGGYQPVTVTMNGQPLTSDTLTGLTTGQYIFEARDSQNCLLTDTVTLSSLVFMNPAIFAEPLTGNSPLTVNFSFNAEGAQDWLWHFSETETDTSSTPAFTFFDYGSHLVRLDVMSGPPYNCTETTTLEIFVDVIVIIDANNVFTPNGDGIDDFFEIKTSGIKEIDANIYNLWGNRVNRITDLSGRWDGTTEGGASAPDGTYFWSLKATGADHIVYERDGCVLLLRHAAQAIPNPARDLVQVKLWENVQPPVEIRLYTAQGVLIRSEQVTDTGHITTDLTALRQGIYFIRVISEKSEYFVRVVKN